MMKIKKINLTFLFLILSTISYSSNNKINQNKSRIEQINKQVNTNKTKIKDNSTKISVAINAERTIRKELNSLNYKINKFQREYNYSESRYIKLLKDIGKNETEIRNSIKEIGVSNQNLEYNKNEYASRIKTLDRVRKSRLVSTQNYFDTVIEEKKNQDEKKILELQSYKIKNIEYYKKTIENNKKKVEEIKNKNLREATRVKSARIDLDKKRKDLEIAKKDKDKKVQELKKLQSKLGIENQKMRTEISSLIREKIKIETEIKRIINNDMKQNSKTTIDNIKIIKGKGKIAMPINGAIVVAFGQENINGLKSNGIEIRGKLGQDVKASEMGRVLNAMNLGSLGGVVIIDHNGIITVYGNLASIRVKKNQHVQKGEVIGTLGRDSATKETNLYFETRKGVNLVDPLDYL